MAQCAECNTELPDDATFCAKCGTPRSAATPEATEADESGGSVGWGDNTETGRARAGGSMLPRLLGGVAGLLLLAVLIGGALFWEGPPLRGGGNDAGLALAERWLRVGEDVHADVSVHNATVPPALADLLNPGTDGGQRVSLPVHADAKLLGSYHLRGSDGQNTVWLIYDTTGSAGDVARRISEQLNQAPWQVVGGQGNEAFSVVNFQNTGASDLEGSAIVQESPSTDDYKLTVVRDGKDVTFTVRRGAPVPKLGAGVGADLVVQQIEGGAARTAGLRNGDRIAKVNDTPVNSPQTLEAALHSLITTGERRASITYLMRFAAPGEEGAPQAASFVPPAVPLALPAGFPAPQAWQGMTVVEHAWATQQGGRGFAATFASRDSSAAVAGRVRDGLTAAGWKIDKDAPVGFATQLDISNQRDGLTGQVQIDLHPQDQAFVQVEVRVQSGAPAGG